MKPARTALSVFLFWTIAAGGVYPLFVTGIGALFFPKKAGGSLIVVDGAVRGSPLIGQDFQSDFYFHSRPSAVGYDARSSGAGNQGVTSKALKDAYEERKTEWVRSNGTDETPMEMLFASGSGLDPDISPRAAELQADRVARARGIGPDRTAELSALIDGIAEGPQWGVLGEPRVNVLELNLVLDKEFPR
jgi:potassium-transporting ATPase KdpC subunit